MKRTRWVPAVAGALLSTVLLSGCALDAVTAAGAAGALDAQAAAGAQREEALMKAAAGRATLAEVASAASMYAALHEGSMSGFAAEFAANEPAVRGQLSSLSDTAAAMSVAAGQCVTVALPGGTPADVAC